MGHYLVRARSPNSISWNIPAFGMLTALSPGLTRHALTVPSPWYTVAATGFYTWNGSAWLPASRAPETTVKNGVTTMWNPWSSYSEYVPLNTSRISTYGLVLLISPLFIRLPPWWV